MIVETLIEEAMRIAADQVAAGTPSGAPVVTVS
jgi:(E)-4-hydroxy-3-methylbut-2-enyl-diphosphate synthase